MIRATGAHMRVGIAIILVCLFNLPLTAHHAIAAKFDPAKTVTLNGSVVEIDWANPHAHLFINVTNGNTIANWAIELESPIDLQRAGWRPDSLKPGDIVTVQGISARDGSKQAWANSVVVTATRKSVFAVTNPAPRRNQPSKPAPR